jgi:SAM-dependent methyltransferase
MVMSAESESSWRKVSEDPNALAVRQWARDALDRAYAGRIADTTAFLRDFVSGQSVLDVGVVQHCLDQVDMPHWRHGQIRKHAARVVGVDIIEPAVAELCKRGFDVRCVDATSEQDLGDRFDRVVLGEVIEHVDAPVALLKFARRHLSPGGRILATTPNPHFVTYALGAFARNGYLPNAEHVAWFTTPMALELAERAGLRLKHFWHVQGEGKTLLRRAAVLALSAARLRDAPAFAPTLYFEFVADP